MIGKRFAVRLTAVAVMGAFAPAFAQSQSGEQSVSSSTSANQSSTDVNSSSTMDQSASNNQASATGSTSSQASTDSTQAGSAASGATASSSEDDDKRGKAKGLDRADEVAGEHGQHGRDNARAHQGGG